MFTCQNDPSHTKTEVIKPNGHQYGEWAVKTAATETQEGLKERSCAACGEKETQVINKVEPTQSAATIKASGKIANLGKKTVIKITSDSGTKITIKGKNARAKNKKFVKIKNGKTAKLTFSKNAVKGKYTFTVTTAASAGFKSTTKTISIKVK